MIALGILIEIFRSERAIAAFWLPMRPAFPFAFGFGAKRGVILSERMSGDVVFKTLSALRVLAEKPTRQCFENAAFERHRLTVFDQRRGAQTLHLGDKARGDD